jgi:hypothetical protein
MSPAHRALNRRARLTFEGVVVETLFVVALCGLCVLLCAVAYVLASL